MNRLLRHIGAAAVAALALAPSLAAAQGAQDVYGVWRNPKNSVHVELKPCGDRACGYVVWASEKAQRDAREGGTPNLIGLQIFRELTPTGDGFKGKIFVPDLNRTFSGQAQALDDNRLKAKGCLVAGVLCKSQVWTRTG